MRPPTPGQGPSVSRPAVDVPVPGEGGGGRESVLQTVLQAGDVRPGCVEAPLQAGVAAWVSHTGVLHNKSVKSLQCCSKTGHQRKVVKGFERV